MFNDPRRVCIELPFPLTAGTLGAETRHASHGDSNIRGGHIWIDRSHHLMAQVRSVLTYVFGSLGTRFSVTLESSNLTNVQVGPRKAVGSIWLLNVSDSGEHMGKGESPSWHECAPRYLALSNQTVKHNLITTLVRKNVHGIYYRGCGCMASAR